MQLRQARSCLTWLAYGSRHALCALLDPSFIHHPHPQVHPQVHSQVRPQVHSYIKSSSSSKHPYPQVHTHQVLTLIHMHMHPHASICILMHPHAYIMLLLFSQRCAATQHMFSSTSSHPSSLASNDYAIRAAAHLAKLGAMHPIQACWYTIITSNVMLLHQPRACHVKRTSQPDSCRDYVSD